MLQLQTRDKAKVLRKYLKGAPRESVGDDTIVKSVDEAFAILIQAFGNPRETWYSILNDFKKKCMNIKGWNAYGLFERHQLTFRTVEFLRKALSYAEEFPQLSNEIFHPNTVDAVIKVLPEALFLEIRRTDEFTNNLN